MRLIALSVLLLTGCAELSPRIMRYTPLPAIEIRIADEYTVDKNCTDFNSKWDNGSRVEVSEHMAGCAQTITKNGEPLCLIWVQQDCPKTLTHELAHCAGHADPEKDGFNWQD